MPLITVSLLANCKSSDEGGGDTPKSTYYTVTLDAAGGAFATGPTYSFDVEEGEIVAFLGPNGAGKSTTIKMLTGILERDEGDIKIMGIDPSTDRKKLAKSIGTVFQGFHIRCGNYFFHTVIFGKVVKNIG